MRLNIIDSLLFGTVSRPMVARQKGKNWIEGMLLDCTRQPGMHAHRVRMHGPMGRDNGNDVLAVEDHT